MSIYVKSWKTFRESSKYNIPSGYSRSSAHFLFVKGLVSTIEETKLKIETVAWFCTKTISYLSSFYSNFLSILDIQFCPLAILLCTNYLHHHIDSIVLNNLSKQIQFYCNSFSLMYVIALKSSSTYSHPNQA